MGEGGREGVLGSQGFRRALVIGADWEDWAALLPWRGPMHFIFAQD